MSGVEWNGLSAITYIVTRDEALADRIHELVEKGMDDKAVAEVRKHMTIHQFIAAEKQLRDALKKGLPFRIAGVQ